MKHPFQNAANTRAARGISARMTSNAIDGRTRTRKGRKTEGQEAYPTREDEDRPR